MAHFIADIQGQAGSASRLGSKSSGISGHIRGWNVGVRVSGYCVNDGDAFDIYATGGSNGRRPDWFLGSVHLVDGVPTFVK